MALQVALGGPHGPRDARQRVILEATGALAGGPVGGRTWHGGRTMAVSCRVWRQTCQRQGGVAAARAGDGAWLRRVT